MGLHAAVPLPEGLALIYDGLVLDEHDVAFLKQAHGVELSQLYARRGPKRDAIKYMLFGQFAPKSSAAHLVNACTAVPKAAVTCSWGYVVVNEAMLEKYDCMKRLNVQRGDRWPCIRTARPIAVNEELIVAGYGAGFWCRFDRERDWERLEDTELYRLPFLQPRLRQFLQDRQQMVATGVRTVRLLKKRPRSTGEEIAPQNKRARGH